MKCVDCGYFCGNCEEADKDKTYCEKFIKANRIITKLDEIDNGYYKFSRLETKDDIQSKE